MGRIWRSCRQIRATQKTQRRISGPTIPWRVLFFISLIFLFSLFKFVSTYIFPSYHLPMRSLFLLKRKKRNRLFSDSCFLLFQIYWSWPKMWKLDKGSHDLPIFFYDIILCHHVIGSCLQLRWKCSKYQNKNIMSYVLWDG